jgi:hypothetical protein
MKGYAGLAVASLLAVQGQGGLQVVAGMELTYASNGTNAPPWRVESVERDVALGGRTGCLRVRYFPGGPRPAADVRLTCEFDGNLHAWNGSTSAWVPTRPLHSGGTLTTRSNGAEHRYVVGDARVDTVSGHPIQVLETTMVTSDSVGRPIRRLRERYAPVLGTATWGVFEQPDSTAPGGWKVVQEFRIVHIKRP